MRPVEIAKGIYNVGVIDWNVRDFHGYSTSSGTTYNAFLIIDEKVVLVDTVKSNFVDELLENISAIIDPSNIDYVISNHAEMDHSGGLPRIMHIIGKDKPVYCSKMGARNLGAHFSQELNYKVVDAGLRLDIGTRSLSFMETRMLHWPDSMFTMIPEEGILFSSDAFGQHHAGHEMFDDEAGPAIFEHAEKYYANILLPYSDRVSTLLKTVSEAGLDFNLILPDHGILWRKETKKILRMYDAWSQQKAAKKAIVLYETMWQSTEKMAKKIAAGIKSEGVDVIPMNARIWHRSDVMTELLDAKALVVGSPTLNNGLYPTMADALTYIKGLKPKGKIGAAFGSYGWSGEAVKILNGELESMGIEILNEGLKIQYVPDAQKMKACFDFGKAIGQTIVSSV